MVGCLAEEVIECLVLAQNTLVFLSIGVKIKPMFLLPASTLIDHESYFDPYLRAQIVLLLSKGKGNTKGVNRREVPSHSCRYTKYSMVRLEG